MEKVRPVPVHSPAIIIGALYSVLILRVVKYISSIHICNTWSV